MSKNSVTIKKHPGTSTLVRPKFSGGMLLQHEDLGALKDYTRELSRLMFRSLFGCGVICGLGVKVDAKCGKVCLTVGAGVALACSGDPVEVPQDQSFAIDENCDPDIDSPLWVVLCGTVKQCAPRNSMCASDDDEAPAGPTRERDGFEIRVVRQPPQCVCGCPEPKTDDKVRVGENECRCVKPYVPEPPGQNCYDSHYDGKCGCHCGAGSNCDCKCILLAQLIKNEDDKVHPWNVDHRVRRFIRPILMRDPQTVNEEQSREQAEKKVQNLQYLAKATEDARLAYKYAADLGASALEAANQALEVLEVKTDKVATADAAAKQASQAWEVAEMARVAAEKARGAVEKAAPAKKPAADQAADTADKKWKAAMAKADKDAALSQMAAAEAERVIVESDTAVARARKMEQDRAAAHQNAVDAEEKVARLKREIMPR